MVESQLKPRVLLGSVLFSPLLFSSCCSSQREPALLRHLHTREALLLNTLPLLPPSLGQSGAFPTATWSASCSVPPPTPRPRCNGLHPTLHLGSDRCYAAYPFPGLLHLQFLIACSIKRSKTGGVEGLGTRLVYICM